MPNSGLSASTGADLIKGAGLIYVGAGAPAAAAPFAATVGGVRVTLTAEMRNPDFDGKVSDVAGLDRVVGWDASIVVTLKEVSSAKLLTLFPGMTSATASGVTTFTPPAANAYLTPLDHVRAVFPLGDGRLYVVYFRKARAVRSGVTGADRGEGTFEVTFVPLLNWDGTTVTTDTAPYVEQIVNAGTALPTL